MKIRDLVISGVALAALSVPAVFAQAPGTVQDRKDDQQDRIAQGVQSGQLTAGETKNLENKEAGVNKEEHVMRSEDDGHLTGADRTKLNNQQIHLSNQIHAEKHNAAQQHYGNSEVGQRQQNQQQRIAQGIKSGQLTAGESAHLEGQQQGINHEVRNDRAANGGHLTANEHAAVNRQQNRASNHIYADKHNSRKA